MARNIFIGIDGGGTKSKVRIEDENGNLLSQAIGGPSNIRFSIEKAWFNINSTIAEALNNAGLALHDPNVHLHVGMGLAGCEVTKDYDDFVNYPHVYKTVQVTSDSHVACLGAHQGRDGGIIIIGTGVVGYQIQHGKSTRVGGWGFPHDDEGGGAWLGLELTQLTFQMLDHREEKSPLTDDVLDFFNQDTEKFIAWANVANSSEFARLAPIVINHVQQHEPNAIKMMKRAANYINKIGATMYQIQNDKSKHLPISLFGGIASFIEPFLEDSLRAVLVERLADANAGAIALIREYVAKRGSA